MLIFKVEPDDAGFYSLILNGFRIGDHIDGQVGTGIVVVAEITYKPGVVVVGSHIFPVGIHRVGNGQGPEQGAGGIEAVKFVLIAGVFVRPDPVIAAYSNS